MENINQHRTADPFRFHNGHVAYSVDELQQLCREQPREAGWHLQSGHLEPWLVAAGRSDLARAASHARTAYGDANHALQYFQRECTLGAHLIREDAQLAPNIRREWWVHGRVLAYIYADARPVGLTVRDDISRIGRAWHPHTFLLIATDVSNVHLFSALTSVVEVMTNPLAVIQEAHLAGREPFKRCIRTATIERRTWFNRSAPLTERMLGKVLPEQHSRTFFSRRDAISWLLEVDKRPCELDRKWGYRY